MLQYRMLFIRLAFMVIIASAAFIAPVSAETALEGPRFDYSRMRQDELAQVVDTLKSQIGTLEKNQKKYRRGVDPEYAQIQKKIDELEAERAAAYNIRMEGMKHVRNK